MSRELTLEWLRQAITPYPNKDRVYTHVDAILPSYPSLRPKTDIYTYDDGRTQLLLCIHGLLPITFRQSTYNIPITMWITLEYPREPPIVYVVPTSDMLVKAGKFVDISGKCQFEYMEHWARKSEGCDLKGLVEVMQQTFSRDPPVYAKPRGSFSPQRTSTVSSTPPGASPPARPPPLTSSPARSVTNPQPQPSPSLSPSPSHPINGQEVRPAPPPKPSSSSSPLRNPATPPVAQDPVAQLASRPPPPPPAQRYQPARSFAPTHQPTLSQPQPLSYPPRAQAPQTYQRSASAESRPPPPPFIGYNSHPAPPPPPPESQRWSLPPQSPHFSPLPQTLQAHHTGYANQQMYSPPPPPPLPPTVSPPVVQPPPPRAPIPNLLDSEDDFSSFPNPQPTSLPPRPPNPELLRLHSQIHHALSSEVHNISQTLSSDSVRQQTIQQDLLAGEAAIRDEMARLEAVRDVCLNVRGRLRDVVGAAEDNVKELKRKGDPEVDELVCSTTIVYNQLINLTAEDSAIEDTMYHLHRALNAGRIELDTFIKTTRTLAEEQFMKRALIEKINTGISMGAAIGW